MLSLNSEKGPIQQTHTNSTQIRHFSKQKENQPKFIIFVKFKKMLFSLVFSDYFLKYLGYFKSLGSQEPSAINKQTNKKAANYMQRPEWR